MIRDSIEYYRWKAMRSLARLFREKRPVRVVIFGEHSQDWMTALTPHGPMWKGVARAREVLLVSDAAALPPADGDDIETVVIPLMEDHARNRPRRHRALAPDRRAIDTLGDKAAFARYVKANGLAGLCPQIYDDPESAIFPCVLKRIDLNAGQGVTLVRSREELEQRLEEDTWRGHPTILQALAPGFEEYVTHCVCRRGRVLWHCSFAYTMAASDMMRTPANVGSIRAIPAARGLIAKIEAFLSPLAYDGPCNVDYKMTPDGKLVVMEINPRLGGSLMRPENVEQLARALSEIIDAAAP
jgi:hypothetical protein